MADVAIEANLAPDDSALVAASKLFGYLWTSAWEQRTGTVDGDADALHDMRVALRRLRTAMETFEGPKTAPLLSTHLRGEIRDERGRIGGIGDRLGNVRDHDVLVEYLQNYAKKRLRSELANFPGLLSLEKHLTLQRAKAFPPLVKRLERAGQPGGIREKYARWALGLPAAEGAGISLTTAAHLILPRHLDSVLSYSEALEPGGDPEEQHDLRKALRRLRYSLESLSVCFDRPVKPYVKLIVDLQDTLGEMQDRVVLQDEIGRAFGQQLPEDIAGFSVHSDRRRRYLLGHVRSLWDKAQTDGVWGELREMI